MAMDISPYIFFSGGKCREAFTFYKDVLGGDLMVFTGADMPASDNVSADPLRHPMAAQRRGSSGIGLARG